MIKLDIEIEGIKEVSSLIQGIDRKLKNLKEPLEEAAKYMLKETDKNFAQGGGVTSSKWKALSGDYESRKSAKYGSTGILQATGRMRRSFRSTVNKTRAEISNTTDYFKYHQSNKPRRALPRRAMLGITRVQQAEINRIFARYLNKITK